jgi:hypothetical protein
VVVAREHPKRQQHGTASFLSVTWTLNGTPSWTR